MIGSRATSGLGRDEVEERRHRLLAVEQVGVHVHVEEVRAAAHLLERDVERLLVVAGLDEAAEPCRAGDVRALADHDEVRVGVDRERLEAGEDRERTAFRHPSRRHALHGGGDLADVLRRRAAAAADDVHEPVARELAEEPARVGRVLVVAAQRVRQARVRIARDPRRRDVRELLDERPHLLAAERAVEADDQRPRVLDRRPERLRSLSREVAAAPVDGGEGEPERQLRRLVDRRGDRRLAVQRVEDRLDQQQVDAALAEPADLMRVRLAHRVEQHRPERGLVDARRQREAHVERADRSRDEARPIRRPPRPLVGSTAREACSLDVQLVDDVLERIVGLCDRRRGEGVRRRDVGARGEVVVVDLRDDLRSRHVEQIGIARHVARMVAEPLAAVRLLAAHLPLDQDAPGAVEDRDPVAEDCVDCGARVRHSLSLPPTEVRERRVRSRAL